MRRDVMRYYKNEKKSLKERCLCELYGFYGKLGLSLPKDPPKRSIPEEIANSASHGIGALLAVIGLFILIPRAQSAVSRTVAIVYSLGVICMFLSSAVYHALRHGTAAKRIARRFDYASVYFLIGATFLPVSLSVLSSRDLLPALTVQWSVILFGAISVGVFGPERIFVLHIAIYLLLGWSALLLLPRMLAILPALAFRIFGGGILFTVGVIPCAMEWNGAHFLWHIFVLAGVFVQWSGVALFY